MAGLANIYRPKKETSRSILLNDMSARRTSLSNSAKKVYIDKNSIVGEAAEIRVENMTDAKPITSEELEDVVLGPIRFTDDNAERLRMLESVKEPYLFCSDDLLQIVEVTPSLKTRIEMIHIIGPRLTDPSAKVASFTDMFRYTEDKHSVEEVLKVRMNAINALKFTNKAGGGALRGGAGRGAPGRGGGRMAPAVGGRAGRGVIPGAPASRGSDKASPSRQMAAPVGGSSSRGDSTSPRTSPRITPKTPLPASKMTLPAVTPEAQPTTPFAVDKHRDPEISPEESALLLNSSPVSQCETDAETVSTKDSVSAPTTRQMEPMPDVHSPTVRPQPINISAAALAQRSQPSLGSALDSPMTDKEGFTPSTTICNTPVETKATPAEHVPVPVPVAAVVVEAAKEQTAATSSLASSLFSSVTADEEPSPVPPSMVSRTTPVPQVPLFEFTARAPQRGPPPPTRRTSNSSAAVSPVPSSASVTPTISPSTSSTNLAGLGQGAPHSSAAAIAALNGTSSSSSSSGRSSAAAPTAPAPAPTHVGGSYASQSGTYDLSPMVADCKPEVGVHALLSRFAGTGGTATAAPSKPPVDTPAKGRKIGDLVSAFAMKPATSTASSTIAAGLSRGGSFRNVSTSGVSAAEARSEAPAPIVIPGAKISLAEMRAKFSGSASTSVGSPSRSSAAATFASTSGGSKDASAPPTERKIVRRHSESLGSINPANSAFAAAIAAVNNQALGVSNPADNSSAAIDHATRCALAVHLTRAEFVALQPEPPMFAPDVSIDGDQTALPQYSYREMVRRNFNKDCADLDQSILELYVCDGDFYAVFLRTKEEYAKQPRWRQVEQKKKALLF